MSSISRSVPAVLLAAVFATSNPVLANPTGAQVIAGDIRLEGGAGGLTVTQGTSRAIINWSDFSIGAGEWTKFVQPDASSAVLNRVISGAPSALLGNLQSNGRVFLINPNGVLIGADARIDVGGFLASTLDVSNESFLNGDALLFRGDSGAAVQNLGKIDASGGDVFLISKRVDNSGTIRAQGTAAMAAGSEVLLTTDNRIFIRTSAGTGDLSNQGQIEAARAELHAAGGNSSALAINHTGTIRATGVAERDGQVWLVAERGDVVSSGDITANRGSAGAGGEVRVLGDRVALTDSARIQASGTQTGGNVLVGGDFQGANSAIKNARATTVAKGASIEADGAEKGGRVIVWADEATRFGGSISTRGGGFVEVSGKDSLVYGGSVHTGGGTLLLDPEYIVVSAGSVFNGGGTDLADGIWGTAESGDTIGVDNLRAALATGSVTLQASEQISWDSGAILDYDGIGTGKTLTLQAGHDLNFSGRIHDSSTGGDSLGVVFNADRDANGTGAVHLFANSHIASNGGDIVFGGGSDPRTHTAYGTAGSNDRAVFIRSSTVSAGAGNIVMQGTGGKTSAEIGIGVDIVDNSVVETSTGNILINGYGATDTSDTNLGISIFNGTQIRTTAGGSITLNGHATATGAYNAGVNIANNTTIQTLQGGDITLTGSGSSTGTGSLNHGVYILDSSKILMKGSGTLTLNGTGGAGSSGIATLTGTNVIGSATAGDFTGNLIFNTDTISLANVALRGAGAFVLQPLTLSQTLGLGNSATGGLNLTATELATLQGGFSSLTFGHANGTGNVDVRTASFTDPVVIRSPSGSANITINGALSTGAGASAGSIDLWAGNSISVATGGSLVTQGQAVVLNSDRDASGAGSIAFASGTSLRSNGGHITLRGGNAALNTLPDPKLDGAGFLAALEATAARGTSPGSVGVSLANATLDAAGGNIDLRGVGSGNRRGVEITAASSARTTGSGAISIAGASGTTVLNSDAVYISGASTAVTSVDGTISILGYGRGTGARGVQIGSGAVIKSTGAGDITVSGRSLATGGATYGAYLTQGTVQTTGGGNISIRGAASSAGTQNNNEGVKIADSSLVEIQAGGGRTLSIDGAAGTGTNYNIGVNVLNSTVRMGASVTGEMVVTGIGGAASGTGNWGVLVENNGVYESLGAASITFNGTGGTGTDNHGIKHSFGAANRVGSSTMTGDITFNADTIDLQSGGGVVTVRSAGALRLQPLSAGTTIGLGNSATGTLNLNTTELSRLADGFSSITVGRADGTGAIDVRAATFNDALTLLNTGAGSAGIAFAGALNLGANRLTASSAGAVTQSSALTADSLLLSGPGSFVLDHAGNQVGVLAASGTGALSFTNNGALTVGSVGGVNGISGGVADVTLRTVSGSLSLAESIHVGGAGNISLRSGGNFINNAGAHALSADAGRWLVGSEAPASDSRGGLVAGFKQYNATLGVTAPAQSSGNGFLYRTAPVLTPVLSGTVTKTYDGTTAAAIDATDLTASGILDGDTVTLAAAGSATYTDKNVGSEKSVGLSGISLVSASNGSTAVYGYQLGSTSATGVGAITPAPLFVTADNASRLYGSPNPAFSATYSGFVNGESASLLTGVLGFKTSATAGTNVGHYAIMPTGLRASNYAITYVPGTLSVTPAPLLIAAHDLTKIYGETLPSFTASFTGLRNGDSAGVVSGLTLTSTATAGSGVGHYAIVPGGASALNYDITYASGQLSVTPAPLLVIADSFSRSYGAANPTLTATFKGLVNGDDAGAVHGLTLTTSATAGSAAGAYAITPSGGTAANYELRYFDGVLAIDKALLVITADDVARLYGAANPQFTAQYSGLQNGDTAAVINGLQFSTDATSASNVGAYTITSSGASSGNYAIAYVPGLLKVDPAPLTIAAPNASRLYGANNPTLAPLFTGLVNGDTPSLFRGLQLSTTASASSNVGTYAITPEGAYSKNYNIQYVPGTLSIDPAPLTVKADDVLRRFGTNNPALTATFTGLVNGDEASVISGLAVSTTATSASPIGQYAITVSGSASPNYTVTYLPGVLDVFTNLLTITANNASMVYGSALPAFSASFDGLLGGDSPSVVTGLQFSTTATVGSNVGTYSITPYGGSAANYSLSYVPGTLTIDPAALTITALDASRVYGSSNPAFGARYDGFVLDDTAADLEGSLVFATSATSGSGVGTYAVTASGVQSSNYAISFVDGALSVTPAALTVTARDAERLYGSANPALTADITGLVNGDSASVVSGLRVSTEAADASPVGQYAILGTGASASNYTIHYVPGTLRVNPAPLLVTASNASRGYGQANPAFAATYEGFVLGEDATVLGGTLVFATAASATSPVGAYAITPSGLHSSNYVISYLDGRLSIGQQLLTIRANNAARRYGSVNPQFTATYEGFIGNDDPSIVTDLRFRTEATLGSGVGQYSITPYGASAGNYAITYEPGVLTIDPASLTIRVNDFSRTFGSTDSGFTSTFLGLLNGDTADVVSGLTYVTEATGTSSAGQYQILASGASAANYTIQYTPGTLTVRPPALVIDNEPAVVPVVNDRPALTPEFAVVSTDDRLALLPVTPATEGGSASVQAGRPSLDQQLSSTLSTLPTVAPAPTPAPTAPASSTGPSTPSLPAGSERGFVLESSVSMGNFQVVYRENLDTARQTAEANAASASSFREFSEDQQPSSVVVRTTATVGGPSSREKDTQPDSKP